METIYLAITKTGLETALEVCAQTGATVWCGADTMSEGEFDCHAGLAVSRLSYSIDDADDLDGAIETVREHHPKAVIWVETQS